MQKFSRELVAEVLAANDIVDIIGAALDLKPAGGGRFKALCPFHREKTPSFTVNQDRQAFHCFGCGKGGDAISFIRDHEGLPFMEALQRLADRAGIRLPAAGGAGGDKEAWLREQLLKLGKFAAKHYVENLDDSLRGARARQYLKTRELKPETLRKFSVGYALAEFDGLLSAARTKGFRDEALEKSGLVRIGQRGGRYDFFRNRITFPIKDIAGNVVAFGARAIDPEDNVKYINSPETSVYRKSRVLYGLHEARDAIRRERRALLVEGYFDLLRCFDAGIENVVATCGTALTSEQATLLRRYAPEVVLVFDGDAAGVRAALKATGVLSGAGLTVRTLALPDEQDPDDFVRHSGAGAFRELVEEAPDFVTFYVRMNEGRAETIEGRTGIANEVFQIFRELDDEIRLDEYLRRLAERLGINEYACRREYEKFLKSGRTRKFEKARKEEEPRRSSISHDDCLFVTTLLSDENMLATVREGLGGVSLGEGPLSEVLAAMLEAGGEGALLHALESEEAKALYSRAATLDAPDAEVASRLVRKRLNAFRVQALRARSDAVARAIEEAERARDFQRTIELIAEKADLDKRLQKVGAV